MKRKVLSIFVMASLLLSVNNLKVNADVVDLEKGYIEKGNKVSIINEKGLMYFAEQVNAKNDYAGKYVTLSSDIDLKDYTWVSIGNGNRSSSNEIAFRGTFDGYNHKIKNLNVSGNDANGCYGLFGVINEATITNVILESGNITSDNQTTGGIVACMLGNKNTVENNTVGKDVTITGDTTGGVVGRAYGKENYVYNNTSAATVTGLKKTGGIVGIDNNVSILYGNKNTGKITGGTDGTAGILGYGNGNTIVANCENDGDVTATRYIGGVVGYAMGSNSYIIYSVNNGKITSENSTGGILGILAQSGSWHIQNCKNNGEITGGTVSLSTLGGVAGGLSGSGSITNCENTATVIGGTYAGGIAGQVNAKSYIKNNKGGTAKIEGNKFTGRLLGSVTGSSTDILSGNAARLFIDDNNGDSYDGIMSVGVVAPLTGNSLLIVEEGTLHGAPYAGTQARIFIQSNAKWDFKPDAAGKMYKDVGTNPGKDNATFSNTWEKEIIDYGSATSSVEATTTENGQRKYLLNGVEKTETIIKVPILWDSEQKSDGKLATNVSFKANNDESNKAFAIDKLVKLSENEVIQDSNENRVGVMFLGSNDSLASQVKYFVKVNYNTNGGDEISQKVVYLTDLSSEGYLDLTDIPVREGYTFDGWFFDKELTQKVNYSKVKKDVTVYAKWIKNKKNPENIDPSPKTDEAPAKTEEENPKTYDNIIIYILCGIGLIGIIAAVLVVRKKLKLK